MVTRLHASVWPAKLAVQGPGHGHTAHDGSHKKTGNDNDPKIIGESQRYLRDFTRIAAEETTTAGIVARMTERYPDWENLRTLWPSARTAIARKNG